MQASTRTGMLLSAIDAEDFPGDTSSRALSQDLRAAMSCFATGIAVVTCRTSKGIFGFTANSFQSVSLSPPIVSFCIARTAWSVSAFEEAAGYGISVLASHQEELAQRFARRGEDKWKGVSFADGHSGAPVLHGALATFECTPCRQIEAGDHFIFLGRVGRVNQRSDAPPLVFFRGQMSAECFTESSSDSAFPQHT